MKLDILNPNGGTGRNDLAISIPTANLGYSGITARFMSDGGCSAGQVCKNTGSGYVQATSYFSLEYPVFALALEDINDGDEGLFLLFGYFKNIYNGYLYDSENEVDIANLGAPIYVADENGGIMGTIPSETDAFVQVLGSYIGIGVIFFNPQLVTIQIA